ncbi:hypothetical protein ACFYUK_24050 [Nonomuraea wenchangensis]
MSFDRHLAEIAREYPQWTIWRSDAGRWWATRHHPLSAEQRDAGCAMTIDADDPEGLRDHLRDQERRAGEPQEWGAGPAPPRRRRRQQPAAGAHEQPGAGSSVSAAPAPGHQNGGATSAEASDPIGGGGFRS